MYKLELKKKGKIIKSIDDWYNAAPPKNPSLHWKDGRSAKELAKYMRIYAKGNREYIDEVRVQHKHHILW